MKWVLIGAVTGLKLNPSKVRSGNAECRVRKKGNIYVTLRQDVEFITMRMVKESVSAVKLGISQNNGLMPENLEFLKMSSIL